MKKLLAVMLSLALAACAAPVQPEPAPDGGPGEGAAGESAPPAEEAAPDGGALPEEGTAAQPDPELAALVDALYEAAPVPIGVETTAIDLADAEWAAYRTCLPQEELEALNAAVASEAMINAQAYLLVAARIREGADAQEVAQSMLDHADFHRWVCVFADKAAAAGRQDVVLFVLCDSGLVDPATLIDTFSAQEGGADFTLERDDDGLGAPDFLLPEGNGEPLP